MESVRYLDLEAQYDAIRTEVITALEKICESGRFAKGPATTEFEAKFADYCEAGHCVSLNSGTSALHLALRCLDAGPGDEVITVAMTFKSERFILLSPVIRVSRLSDKDDSWYWFNLRIRCR